MKTFQEFINEGVEVSHSNYQNTHSRAPKGMGSWVFSHNKNPNLATGKEGIDYVTHNGTYTEAKNKAKSWAKSQGHSLIHVAT